jgi:hypothetical protein
VGLIYELILAWKWHTGRRVDEGNVTEMTLFGKRHGHELTAAVDQLLSLLEEMDRALPELLEAREYIN